VECGIGSTNKKYPHTMDKSYISGSSLRVWRDFFPNAEILGADIDKESLLSENRSKCFFIDQIDTISIKNFWLEIKFQKNSVNLIIDDGFHDYQANINLFEGSIDFLKSDGFYFIEDVHEDQLELYFNYFENSIYNSYFF